VGVGDGACCSRQTDQTFTVSPDEAELLTKTRDDEQQRNDSRCVGRKEDDNQHVLMMC
jgi:hypothetical protein